MSQEYVAKSVRPGKVYDRNEHGAVLQAFYVDFQGPDGKVEQGCYWRRKQGNDPEVGQTYVGDIEEGQFGPRFKQAKGGPPGREVSSSGSSDYGKRNGKSPDQQASIVRQHSQEMSLRALEIFSTDPWREDDLKAAIRKWTDWFAEDADQAATAAGASRSPSAHISQAPAASQPPDDTHQAFVHFLTEAGENDLSASLVANWLMSADPVDGALTAKQQDEALTQLQNPETRSGARDKLRAAYVKANGELPAATPAGDLDDLPF